MKIRVAVVYGTLILKVRRNNSINNDKHVRSKAYHSSSYDWKKKWDLNKLDNW